jgi:uncharacterized membrane protein YhaH (DUF805 family)
MSYYMDVWKKMFQISGRSRRMEYWMFHLLSIPINLVVFLLTFKMLGILGIILFVIFMTAATIAGFTCMIRRLHDTDRTGWLCLLYFVPVVGWIVLLIFMFLDGTKGENQYGPSPKENT